MEYFGRTWAVMVELRGVQRVFEGMAMQARARWPRPADGQPTTELTLHHPDPSLYGLATDPDADWHVLAGYEGATGRAIIGAGQPIPSSVRTRRVGADVTLALTLQASRHAARIIVSDSWPDATTALAVLGSLQARHGFALDVAPGVPDRGYSTGYTAFGSLADVLGRIAADMGAALVMERDVVRLWPRQGPRKQTRMVWSAETGLLEPPTPTGRPGATHEVSLSGRMVPGMRPGDGIQVVTPAWSGALVVLEVEHTADTKGGPWRTSVVGRAP